MRTSVFWFIAVLVGLFLTLNILGAKDEYVVERLLWHMNKRLAFIKQNPDVLPENTFKEITHRYQEIINDFPESALIPQAYISLANVYLIKRDFVKAREVFNEILEKFPNNKELMANAMSRLAKSYEMEGHWTEALHEYKRILNQYPTTEVGILIPLYIASSYQASGRKDEAREAYSVAAEIYRKLSKEAPNDMVKFKSLHFLSKTYLAQSKWHDALDVLSEMLIQFPSRKTALALLKGINQISLQKIKDAQPAILIYEEFMKKNPQHPLNNILQPLVKKLKSWDGEAASPGEKNR